MKKILIATEKPFASVAVEGIERILSDAGFESVFLEKYTSAEELYKTITDADALIVRSDKITKELVNAAANLKIIVRAGAGHDNLDLTSCTERGIVVMNTPGQNSNAVAELALGLMFFMSRNGWNPATGSELKGKKLGIQAYGNVGRILASLGNSIGMDVYAFSRTVSAKALQKDGVKAIKTVHELYATCQYVSTHIPANEQTKRSIGYELISSMPYGGTLINTARKEIIDEDGLFKAMMERNDLKYATDIAPDALVAIKNSVGSRIFATSKKIGAETAEANMKAGLAAAQQIVGFFKKGDTKFQVNNQ